MEFKNKCNAPWMHSRVLSLDKWPCTAFGSDLFDSVSAGSDSVTSFRVAPPPPLLPPSLRPWRRFKAQLGCSGSGSIYRYGITSYLTQRHTQVNYFILTSICFRLGCSSMCSASPYVCCLLRRQACLCCYGAILANSISVASAV